MAIQVDKKEQERIKRFIEKSDSDNTLFNEIQRVV